MLRARHDVSLFENDSNNWTHISISLEKQNKLIAILSFTLMSFYTDIMSR
jgi:hypothetical protein